MATLGEAVSDPAGKAVLPLQSAPAPQQMAPMEHLAPSDQFDSCGPPPSEGAHISVNHSVSEVDRGRITHTIRDLHVSICDRLHVRATHDGLSMAAEVCDIRTE